MLNFSGEKGITSAHYRELRQGCFDTPFLVRKVRFAPLRSEKTMPRQMTGTLIRNCGEASAGHIFPKNPASSLE
jgi:hypothetical protein